MSTQPTLHGILGDVQSQFEPIINQLRFTVAPVIRPLFDVAQRIEDSLPEFTFAPIAVVAAVAIVLHVVNYNATAQLEHHTRIFTKIFRSPAVYLYALYLVVSALVRDHYVMQAIETDANSYVLFTRDMGHLIGHALIGSGILLNLWTLKALGIKGMYNGDSFGYLMAAPVTDGPYVLFNDPQYVGTTLALLGYAVKFQSLRGYALTAVLYATFWVSVKFVEGPHMNRIYGAKASATNAPAATKKPKAARRSPHD
ncbi:hypothetical protein PhCBS80983_g01251 [Powellomyces hirtus]|uniref:Phosphatidyl-N-methylethanolamine N-methyltransferase n=1 Tax=Powellomyces hirtus TaxID=109895 RepID=A0A507EBS9_9FUNG|nr:hypothetical protein PhCBS80983_g01251 [Powellomyces hirtus]